MKRIELLLPKIAMLPAVAVLVIGCGSGENAAVDPTLAQGKAVWDGTCRTCHLNGVGGAPPMGNKTAWAPRIEKGIDTLIAHAQNGFEGNEGTMPARGGNANLSDADIAAAVRYMVAQSQP